MRKRYLGPIVLLPWCLACGGSALLRKGPPTVRPGGPADAAGLVPGDEIVAVDGHDVRGAHAYRWNDLTDAAPGVVLPLALTDDREVAVKLGPPE